MSYVVPSTQVYQQLASSGGVLNSTPDLNAVIVGPCYNVVDYVAGSTDSYALTFAGNLTDPSVTNTYTLPNPKPGQSVELGSVAVWFNEAKTKTLDAEAVTATASENTLTLSGTPTKTFTGLTSAGTANAAPGDTVELAWTLPATGSFTTTVLKVIDADNITTADVMPSGVGTDTTLTLVQTHQDVVAQTGDIDTTSTTANGTVDVKPTPTTSYGTLISGKVYVGYRALRTDLAGQILEITSETDLKGQLGVITDENPLALGVSLALANTVTPIYAVAVSTDDLTGHTGALELLEGSTSVYALVPLTQDTGITSAYATHVVQMSTPTAAGWRIALLNTAMPTTKTLGTANKDSPVTGGTITANSGGTGFILTSSTSTFLTDGVVPGDLVNITASSGSQTGAFEVQEVLSNQQILLPNTMVADTGVSFYVDRTLSKLEQSQDIAATSTQFGSSRVIHVQPDTCGVSIGGVTKYLPGYYLCAGVAGMVAGFPVQQGFTNISLAGFEDLKNSNFYFTQDQLNTISGAGTFLMVQSVQGGVPYVRHELTTDMSVLEYRELLVVKNWDYLSYYFREKLQPFIGQWNITADTLNSIHQTIVSSGELLKTKKLPKIGPPLIDYKINSLAQDANNKDTVNINLGITVVYPDNYNNLYLVI